MIQLKSVFLIRNMLFKFKCIVLYIYVYYVNILQVPTFSNRFGIINRNEILYEDWLCALIKKVLCISYLDTVKTSPNLTFKKSLLICQSSLILFPFLYVYIIRFCYEIMKNSYIKVTPTFSKLWTFTWIWFIYF